MKHSAQDSYAKYSAIYKRVPPITSTPIRKQGLHPMQPGRVSDSVLRKLRKAASTENTMAMPRQLLPVAQITGAYGHTIHNVEKPSMTTPALPSTTYEGGTDGITINKVAYEGLAVYGLGQYFRSKEKEHCYV